MRMPRIPQIAFMACLVGGCSTHPLQDDVTGLALDEVTKKIHCESKEAVERLLAENGLAEQLPRLEATIASIAGRKIRDLAPLEKIKVNLDRQKQRLLDTKAVVEADLDLANAKGEALTADIAELKKIISDPTTSPADLAMAKEQLRLAEEKAKKVANQIKRATDAYEDFKAMVLSYNSRSARHNFEARERFAPISKLNEARDAEFKTLLDFLAQSIAIQFGFKINETNKLSSSGLTYKFPIHLGTFTLGISGDDTRVRDSERKANTVFNFQSLLTMDCRGAPENQRSVHYKIKGKIGLYEVIDQYLKMQKTSKLGKLASYTDTITFTTTVSGSIAPSLTIAPTPITTLSAAIGTTDSRKDEHSAIVTLSPSTAQSIDELTKLLGEGIAKAKPGA